jgi:hypothetical protein
MRLRGRSKALRAAIVTSLKTALMKGAPIVRTPVEATHAHGPWMLLQGEMISADVDRTKVELGKRYVISVRELGSSESLKDLPVK